jgi:hypothetical protein
MFAMVELEKNLIIQRLAHGRAKKYEKMVLRTSKPDEDSHQRPQERTIWMESVASQVHRNSWNQHQEP